MIVEPPFEEGAVHETVAWPLPGVAVTLSGALGGPIGIIDPVGNDARLMPAEFIAVTVNVYPVPFVNPVTVQEVPPVVVHVLPSGLDITV